MKIVTLPTKSIAWLRQGLLFLGLVAAYAILFQLCYAWMYTGSPVPDADFGSFFQSILLNYIPMLVIAFSVWLVATRTLHMKSVVAKCLTDLLGSLPVAILLNWLFPLVTGLRVNWGGTAFNFVMIFVFIEFVIYSKRAREVELQEERHQRELLQKRYEVMMALVNPPFPLQLAQHPLFHGEDGLRQVVRLHPLPIGHVPLHRLATREPERAAVGRNGFSG
jgi:hypothetical protein